MDEADTMARIAELKHQIIELSAKDPIVNAVVSLWHNHEVTWEEAMMQAVISLAKARDFIEAEHLKLIQMTPPRPFIVRESPQNAP